MQVGSGVFHLSTSMCPAHRRDVFGEIRLRLASGMPTVCISTQLIEAGVDVDFGAVIRFVAGLDSIAQAAGRCNRNGRRALGRVHVVNPSVERIDGLPDIRYGRDVALRVLGEFENDSAAFNGDLLGPKAMTRYFDYYFSQRASEMTYPVQAGDAARDDDLLNLLAENRLAVDEFQQTLHRAPPIHLRQAFMTAGRAFRAIDAPTQGIVVPYGDEGRDLVGQLFATTDPETQAALLRRAQQYSINLFPQTFDQLLAAGALKECDGGAGVYCLSPQYYSKEFGLTEAPKSSMEILHA